jgi:ribosomal protein L22
MEYFDYRSVAEEARIPPDKLEAIAKMVRGEFPTDDMLYELHVLRACMAIRDGYVSLEDALKPEGGKLKKKPS